VPKRVFCVFQASCGPVYGLMIVRSQHRKAQGRSIPGSPTKAIACQQFMNRHEIAQRLRHLLAFDLKKAVVHPEIRHHRRMEHATRLGDFVFVVREDKIDAAAVDVEHFAEIFPRHRRALDVPAGAAGRGDAGGRWPGGLARRGGFPQDEILRVSLVGRDFDAGAGDQFVERLFRQPAVVGHRRHVEQNVVLGNIRMP